MSSQLTQSWLGLLALVSIASVTSCAIYFLFRAIEGKSQLLSIALSVFILIFWAYQFVGLVAGIGFSFVDFSSPLLVSITFSIVGGFLHRKSGGSSKLLFYAILMMLSISFLVLFINPNIASALNLYSIRPILPLMPNPGLTIWALITIQSIAPPALVLISKNFRLRPGMDKHSDD